MKTILSIVLLLSATSVRGDEVPVRDRIYKFLDQKVIGRTQRLSTEGTIAAEGDTYQVKFEADISWSKLEKTEEGLVFEETRDIRQTNTKLDKAGKPTNDTFKTDRVVVHRYSLGERKLTNSLVGVATVVKSTLEDPVGRAFITMVDLSADNKELYIYQSMAGFAEVTLDGRTYLPAASASDATLFIDPKGKLTTHETLKFYKIDINRDFAREEISRFNLTASEVTK